MSDKPDAKIYLIFQSIHNVMLAEELLIEADISLEMVPVPRDISSDCGMSLTCWLSDLEIVKNSLKYAKFTSQVNIYKYDKQDCLEKTGKKSKSSFYLLLKYP